MKFLNMILVALCTLVISACSSAPKINVDYDTNHNFEAISSYRIVNKQRSSNDLVNDRIISAIKNAMAQRGIAQAKGDDVDILIDFMVVSKDKTRVTSYNSGYGYYGGGYYGNSIDVRQYTEGSLILDLVDPKVNKTIWRGVGTATIEARTAQERTALVNGYTEAIIAQMPL